MYINYQVTLMDLQQLLTFDWTFVSTTKAFSPPFEKLMSLFILLSWLWRIIRLVAFYYLHLALLLTADPPVENQWRTSPIRFLRSVLQLCSRSDHMNNPEKSKDLAERNDSINQARRNGKRVVTSSIKNVIPDNHGRRSKSVFALRHPER